MEFSTLLDRFKKRRTSDIGGAAESTADRYVRHVTTWDGWLTEEREKTIWDAETVDLRAFAEDLIYDGMAATSVSQRVSAVSKFYQDLSKMADRHDLPEVPENPYDGFDKEDRKMLRGETKKQKALKESDGDKYPYLESDKVKQLSENVPAPRLRNELAVRLFFDCGFRREELAKAKVDNVNEDNTIRIPPGKSEGRVVGFREQTAFLLDRWLNRGGRDSMTYAPDSGFIFPTNVSEHISPDYLNRMVKESAENAGIQETTATYADGRKQHKVTAHTLRHSFAMDKLEADVGVTTLQKLMGHTDIETTMIYVHMSDEEAREKSKQFTDF